MTRDMSTLVLRTFDAEVEGTIVGKRLTTEDLTMQKYRKQLAPKYLRQQKRHC
jgi:hypothetical protein